MLFSKSDHKLSERNRCESSTDAITAKLKVLKLSVRYINRICTTVIKCLAPAPEVSSTELAEEAPGSGIIGPLFLLRCLNTDA